MVIGAAGDQAHAGLGKLLGHHLGVGDHLVGVAGEVGLQGLAEADSLGGDDVHEGAALHVGEHGEVNLAAQFLLGEDHAAAGAAQGFLGGGRNDLGMGEGRRVGAAGDEAGNVGHVHHEQRAHGIGDGAEAGEVQHPRVAAATGDDELGVVFFGQPLHLVVVDGLGIAVNAVGHEVVEVAGEVDAGAVGEVAAHVQLHTEHGVAGFQDGEVGGHVGLGAAVGLNVGVLGAEEFFGAVDGQGFHHIHELAAAVVAPAGVALGVLVVHQLRLGLQHGLAGVVFRCDQDDGIALAAVLVLDGVGNGGVDAVENGGHVGWLLCCSVIATVVECATT